MKRIIFILISMCSIIAIAEIRLWEDKKGNILEAEFQCELAGKVVLRDRSGKDHKLSISTLSEKDQRYLQAKIPPKIEIKFKKIQDRTKKYYSSSTIVMYGDVTLTKKSRMPYTGDLKATLFMIGEDSREDEYIMLDRAEFKFDFKTEKTLSFKGEKFKMHQNNYYSTNAGTRYRGYLIAVYDAEGKIIQIKASREEFKEKIKYLSGIKAGEHFPNDMEGKATRSTSSREYH